MTTPKFPPPPCIAQNRSAFSSSLARTRSPVAVTISIAWRLSQVSPQRRSSQPEPPPSVRPVTPVVETRPPVVASPNACVRRSNSDQIAPAPQRAIRRCASTVTSAMRRTSITTPPSLRHAPATEWPPARTAIGSSRSRA